MNIVTAAEVRKPLTFSAWHLKRYGDTPDSGCDGGDCEHFYACYLLSLEALRAMPNRRKRSRK